MTKVKNWDRHLYPSIQDAIHEILDSYLISGFGSSSCYVPVYSNKALKEILFFLAENDIQHQYSIFPAPAGTEYDELVSLVWSESGAVGHEVWHVQGLNQKAYQVCLTVHADDEREIASWVDNIDEFRVLDWSVTEL